MTDHAHVKCNIYANVQKNCEGHLHICSMKTELYNLGYPWNGSNPFPELMS